jgi:hypothetical protein
MPHPKQGYRLKDGTRVPGVTTILGKFKDPGGLMYWAWDLGMQGKDFREERDKAADAGTLAHAMIEAFLSGDDPNEPLAGVEFDIREKALIGYNAYKEWAALSKIEVIEQEMQLVSEEYRFGGTPDAIGYCNGRLSLLDWKTGRVYPEHLCQLGAYRQLWSENRPSDVIESSHLLRFNKDTGSFSHHMFPTEIVDLGWTQFSLLRHAYDVAKKLEKAVK